MVQGDVYLISFLLGRAQLTAEEAALLEQYGYLPFQREYTQSGRDFFHQSFQEDNQLELLTADKKHIRVAIQNIHESTKVFSGLYTLYFSLVRIPDKV